MKATYVLWLVIFLALMCGAIVTAGGSISWYLSIPSFILVFGTAFVLALANFSLRDIGRSFSIGFAPQTSERLSLEKAKLFFEAIQRYLIVAGFLGTMVGAMAMLGSLENVDSLGSGTALALTTALYGLIGYVGVVVPFRTGIRRRLAELASAENE